MRDGVERRGWNYEYIQVYTKEKADPSAPLVEGQFLDLTDQRFIKVYAELCFPILLATGLAFLMG